MVEVDGDDTCRAGSRLLINWKSIANQWGGSKDLCPSVVPVCLIFLSSSRYDPDQGDQDLGSRSTAYGNDGEERTLRSYNLSPAVPALPGDKIATSRGIFMPHFPI
ncbi:MAG: hypothetical protein AB7U31_06025 [Synergistaceae bacterium]